MEHTSNPLVELTIKPFIFLSCIFQSCLEKYKTSKFKDSNLIHSLIQIMYSISISVTSGLILSPMIVLAIAFRYDLVQSGKLILFWVPLVISILLTWIVVLNYKNKEFSLPIFLYSTYWLIKNVDFKTRFWESLINLLIMPILLSCIFLALMFHYSIPVEEVYVVLMTIFLLSFFVSLLIYSESTKKKLIREARQFMVWLLIFIGFLILTIYQINENIIHGKIEENIVNIAITVLGLALTMTTVIDKTRNFYKESFEEYRDDVTDSFISEIKKYSLDRTLLSINKLRIDFLESCKTIRHWWKAGKKLKVVQLFIMLFAISSLPYVMIKNQSLIESYFNFIGGALKVNFVRVLGGNEELSAKVFLLLVVGGLLIKCVFDLVKKYREADTYAKIIYIGRVLGLILIKSIILAAIFTNSLQLIFKWIIIPLIITLGVWSILLTIVEKMNK